MIISWNQWWNMFVTYLDSRPPPGGKPSISSEERHVMAYPTVISDKSNPLSFSITAIKKHPDNGTYLYLIFLTCLYFKQ